jgi:hypothetical protein
VAERFVALLHEAGVPRDALALLHGPGETVGAALVAHPLAAGVCFTGSTQVAKAIQRALALKDGPLGPDGPPAPIVPLIAETGGLNAMVVDSSALPEQVVDAVVQSAFRSAGQRCSALRLLCVHQGVADGLLRMLAGAMRELRIGDAGRLATDVGPVIDARRTPPHAPRRAAAREAKRLAERRRRPRRPGCSSADRLRDRAHRRLRRRCSARCCTSCAGRQRRRRRAGRADQRARLRPHAGRPDAHRQPRRRIASGARRQRLRQPQHDRRGGRRAALRRRGPVGHRPEGRRPALPAALLRRADADDQHRGRGRQRRAAVGRRGGRRGV